MFNYLDAYNKVLLLTPKDYGDHPQHDPGMMKAASPTTSVSRWYLLFCFLAAFLGAQVHAVTTPAYWSQH